MHRVLCPVTLDCDPHCLNAEREFVHWLRTFNNFIEECGDAAPDKLRCLIKYISATVYDYIADEPTFDGAIAILKRMYQKKKNVIFSRYKLATRRQQSSESLDEFLQALHRLSKDCDIKDVSAETYRQELVRDAFINGLSSHSIRQRLLEKQDVLALAAVFDQASALDLAYKNSESYGRMPTSENIPVTAAVATEEDLGENVVAAVGAYKDKRVCFFCGGPVHKRVHCRALKADCKTCGKTGHFAKVCRSGTALSSKSYTASIHTPTLCAMPDCLKSSTVAVEVNNAHLSALIDSGSSESFIDKTVATSLQLTVSKSSKEINLASSLLSARLIGTCHVDFKINGVLYRHVRLGVMNQLCGDIILGQDFQRRHSAVIFEHGGDMEELRIGGNTSCNVVASKIQRSTLFPGLSKDCRPIATKSRRFGNQDKAFIDEEVAKLLSDGVIEPCSSPWRAQVVICKNESNDNKKRMCVDYSRTVNRYSTLDAYPVPKIDEMINNLANYSHFSTFDLKSAYYQVEINPADKPYTAFEANGKLYQFNRIPFGVMNGVAAFQRSMDEIVDVENLKDTFPYLDNITVAGHTQAEHDANVSQFLIAVKKYKLTLNDKKTVSSTTSLNILGYNVGCGRIQPDAERLRPLQELEAPQNLAALRRTLGMFAYYAKWIARFSDKALPLLRAKTFPLSPDAMSAFELLKSELGNATLNSIDERIPFVVECDASDVAVSATLNQAGRPVAFMSRTFHGRELHYPAVEKEATAIIEAVRKWSHFLTARHFELITDQRSVAFMLDSKKMGKIKNDKIQGWRLELASYSYSITYRPGNKNTAPDAFTRAYCASMPVSTLSDIHSGLCHPGVSRMLHFIRSKNLPFSTDDVKKVCASCRICAEIKPNFYKQPGGTLITATKPMERLSVDFKGPVKSCTKNVYVFTAVDEFSRFPFAIPCADMTSDTVKRCLDSIFSLCGMVGFVHSDRGTSFLSRDVRDHLVRRGIACSATTPYHPQSNGQCERYNGIVWKAVRLALKDRGLQDDQWESVLPDVLHSIRSLLSTATNETPHERFFNFFRRSGLGHSLPAWLLTRGPVLLRRFVRHNKNDPLVDEVELLVANPTYARVRYPGGRESTVSLRDLAPCPGAVTLPDLHDEAPTDTNMESVVAVPLVADTLEPIAAVPVATGSVTVEPVVEPTTAVPAASGSVTVEPVVELRRSTRETRRPDRLGFST